MIIKPGTPYYKEKLKQEKRGETGLQEKWQRGTATGGKEGERGWRKGKDLEEGNPF